MGVAHSRGGAPGELGQHAIRACRRATDRTLTSFNLPKCAGEAIKGIPRDQVVIATKWGESMRRERRKPASHMICCRERLL